MPFDRSQIKKGMRLYGGVFDADGKLMGERRPVTILHQQKRGEPPRVDVLKSQPSLERLVELVRERTELVERLGKLAAVVKAKAK